MNCGLVGQSDGGIWYSSDTVLPELRKVQTKGNIETRLSAASRA